MTTITTHPAFPRHRERKLVCEVENCRSWAVIPMRLLGDRNAEAFFRRLLFLRPDERVVIREVEA